MEIKLVLNGLDCANCANKIEDKVNKINGVKEATVNFSTTVLTAEIKEENLKSEISKRFLVIISLPTHLIALKSYLYLNFNIYLAILNFIQFKFYPNLPVI